jgi:O-succinylbenzoic acid--CoA ligase
MLVEGWLSRATATHPARTALQTPSGSWSYAQLLAAARAGAGELRRRGVRPGDRVAIALPAGLPFAQTLHSCLLLGAVAVPVDLRLGAAERARVIGDAAAIIEEPLGEGAPGGGEDPQPTGESPLPTGEGLPPGADGPAPGKEPAGGEHDLDAVAVVLHTSGTTSSPRPVELTYGNFLWSALGSAVALGLDPEERWLCALPLAHVGGLSILLRSAIYGTTAVLHERFDTERVLHALREQRITLVSLVATTLSRLLDAGLTAPTMPSGGGAALRCALVGGGPVPPALVERARAAGVPVSATYGLTEACSQVTTLPVAALSRSGTASAGGGAVRGGTPLFCTRVRVAPDGEILVRGPTVAPAAYASDGWLHTGDLGELDERGLCVVARKADTIVSGGENVAPVEVEEALEAHPDVREAAVVGRSDPEWGEAVTAFVLTSPGASPSAEVLRAHCAARLAPYKVPKRIVAVSEPLPRTASGKLMRRALPR